MVILNGKGASGGAAIGNAAFFRRADVKALKKTVSDPKTELKRFEIAKNTAADELRTLHQRAKRDIGESGAQIFEIHEMMLFDDDYNHSVENTIRVERANAEYAVQLAEEHFADIFSAMDDPYMRARAADIHDISRRLLRILSNAGEELYGGEEAVILCADDLAPSETMQLDKSKISAFITAEGSVNSHTAILARSMGIPAVVGVGDALTTLVDGTLLAVDGGLGRVYVNPDEKTKKELSKKRETEQRSKLLLEKYRGLDNVTLDGKSIELYANIQSISEVGLALLNDAGGIGLFRSEFLYLDRELPPSEEEQFRAYRTVLQSMGGKKVIIRTLDIGADKQVDYLGLGKEENPALGLRAIRICLTNQSLFKAQLRALLRASAFGDLAIMFPMIISVSELSDALTLLARCREELTREGFEISEKTEIGIMIETPAAVMISDRLAPLVDFFSIGTNDLTQYTLAIDRENRSLDRFFDPHHEAILRMIELTVKNAHAHGKWVGICGELGADISLTETFLRMGIDELSVSPASILVLRDKIRNLKLS